MNAFTTKGGYANPPTFTGYRASNGNKYIDWVVTSYGDTLAAGDIIGLALDLDAETITFYRNNVSQGAINLGAQTKASGSFIPTIAMGDTSVWTANFGQDSSFAGAETAQGNQDGNDRGDFYYAVPANHLALCRDNLSAPSIALPGDYFNTKLYDDGAGAKTGVGFQPDLVWVKSRGSGYEPRWTDVVRGVTKSLTSFDDDAEITESTGLTAFGADGFTVGADTDYSDTTGTGMVAWNWKAGGAASANTTGTINSSVSANPTAGFSIVSYTGTGTTAQTVGHGLSIAPDMMIIKSRSIQQVWNVFHSPGSVTGNTVLDLSTADASNTGGNIEIVANASTFGIGSATQVNTSTATFIAYCFNSIEGYSKAGLYVGNGNTDGPFIYTGFRPSWILVKNKTASAYWWIIDSTRDPYNVAYHLLYPNGSNTEAVANYTPIDILSNGWKSRIPGGNGNEGTFNTSGQTYIYYAIAESPFKTSNAR
jgi:hypothetical protein